jgi:hypothetical protein
MLLERNGAAVGAVDSELGSNSLNYWSTYDTLPYQVHLTDRHVPSHLQEVGRRVKPRTEDSSYRVWVICERMYTGVQSPPLSSHRHTSVLPWPTTKTP